MLDLKTSGYEVALTFASILLELDINIITAFCESSQDPVSRVTTIKPLIPAKYKFHLFLYSESDFTSPHYESVLKF